MQNANELISLAFFDKSNKYVSFLLIVFVDNTLSIPCPQYNILTILVHCTTVHMSILYNLQCHRFLLTVIYICTNIDDCTDEKWDIAVAVYQHIDKGAVKENFMKIKRCTGIITINLCCCTCLCSFFVYCYKGFM